MANPFDLPDIVGTYSYLGRPHTLFSDGTLLPVVRGGDGPDDDDETEEPEPLPLGADDEIVIPVPPPDPNEPEPIPAAVDAKNPAVRALIEKARKEEKDKLYAKIKDQDNFLKELKKEREEAAKAAEKAQREAEEARKAKELEEMTAAERIEAYKAEMDARLVAVEQQAEAERAAFEMERQFQALQAYATRRVNEEANEIMPELRDLVSGTNEEEIEQSIALAKDKTSRILAQMQGVVQQQRQSQKGASVTAPPVGPMENDSAHQTLTAEDIRNMDMNEYAQRRGAILGAVSNKARSGGLYGQ